MFGWKGKVLRVDLSRGRITTEELTDEMVTKYLGGRGLGIYYLGREMNPRGDPLSPENILVMATGPLTGTNAAAGSRYMITTKSPLTGALTASNSGGSLPTELKRAGFDAVIFTGRSPEPVYLWINDGRSELRPATHLWGKTVPKTNDRLLSETDPNAKIACIGPGGERLVLFASVMNEKHRAAGRSGVGAVMGSKNLKALAVRGTEEIRLHDDKRFMAFHTSLLRQFKAAAKQNPPALREYGTAYGVAVMNSFGIFPTKNFQQGTFDRWESINGEVLKKNYLVGRKACFACPIGCGRQTKVDVPGFQGEGEGPEYETIYALGGGCMVDNLAAITKSNYLCNELGIDTITMGQTIACAMELVDRGYLSEKEVGRPLKWGDGQAQVALVEMTGYRKDFGDVLAGGSYRLAERYGHPELAMVAKKQEFAGYDPRGEQGMGLAYATSPIGGSHMRGDPAYFEIFGTHTKIDPLEWRGKAALVKKAQDLSCVIDSAGLCIFFAARFLVEPNLEMKPEGIKEYLNAATGADFTVDELNRIGERIFNAERMFLVRAGFSRKEDVLPPRMTREPLPDGPAKGYVCHLEEMLEEYYPSRGWTPEGIPARETLKALELD
ncbi:MAG: aldehyde ferredoxin oxidoreductase family protein [Thermodesulfobacteriota bacterium]